MSRISQAACALLVLATITTPAFSEESKMPRTITLSGHGEIRSAPDLAVVTSGVMTTAASAREALTANNAAMQALLAALSSAGIEAKDMQTSNFMVSPRYEYATDGSRPPKVVGYDVSNNVTVTIRKLDTLGATLDQLVSAGSNQINGIQFLIKDTDKLTDEARKLAVSDASRKAAIYAGAAQLKLGKILSLSEAGGYQPPVPVLAKAMRAEAADGSSVPVAQGEQVVAVDVNIVWEIE